MTRLSQRLQSVLDAALPRLRAITDSDAGVSAGPNRWSARQELGHLIDSAANNHLRFVSAALQPEYHGPGYDQNGSVKLHGYQELDWLVLLDFWQRYNDLIIRVVDRIPEDHLHVRCQIGDGAIMTLEALIDSYIDHLQHHTDHILNA
jgi:hypothetical protein